jgi:mannonate dehydratase
MKLGLGLYTNILTPDNLRFARQAGASHIVAHTPYADKRKPGVFTEPWSYEELRDLKKLINDNGLELEAIENFLPIFWSDVLLDGPRKVEQMEGLKQIIRDCGRVGIPIFGYNFSLAGVWGREKGPWARGEADTVAYLDPQQPPIPLGTVWNQVVDPDAPAGVLAPLSRAELWERYTYFMNEIMPVADEAGVIMALHPDDPPLPFLRDTARLVYQPSIYQQVFDLYPSPNNQAELCLGTVAEMTEGSVLDTVATLALQQKIAYIHFRAVRGKVPTYYEVFIDEGDTDMIDVLRVLYLNDYQGVLIPDHTPSMSCDAPWHAGMAFAMGYMRAAMTMIARES